ncbi:MAG: hypothetical protein ASARMPRED_002097 [Alectoria sarmentosa]|nr:MAG: hypothetical protein ASARMPRED_002097 [Alectoria sarmentosa]
MSTHTLRPHLQTQNSGPLSTTSSQQVSSSAARGPAPATTSTRPQREAATKARKPAKSVSTLYNPAKDTDSDRDVTSAQPSAPRPTPINSDDSSDSDTFVDDSESDCPRLSKAALGRKRKRSKSPTMDEGERRKSKAGKLEMDDRKANIGATGFMVKSVNVMKDIVGGKAGRASREALSRPAGSLHRNRQHYSVRRAGLSDMSLDTGRYMCGRRYETRSKAAEGFAFETRRRSNRAG